MPQEEEQVSGQAWQDLRTSIRAEAAQKKQSSASAAQSLEQNILRLQKIWRVVNLGIGIMGIATLGTGLIALSISLHIQWLFGNWLNSRFVAPLSLIEKFLTIFIDLVVIGILLTLFVIISTATWCVQNVISCGYSSLISL